MPISMASCQFRFAICQFVALACLGTSALCAADDEGRVPIRENTPVGSATRIQVDLTAEGQYEPAPEQGTPAKPVPLRLQARVDFVERVLRLDSGSTSSTRAVRRIEQAVVAFGGGVRPLNTVLRPELGVVLAERGPHAILVQSLGGPLRREELSLLEFPGDPLTWFALLPEKPVAVGDRWSIRDQAVRSLTGYDAIAAARLEAKVDELTDREAVFVLGGEVRGASRGGEGTMSLKGRVRFDRTQERIRAINLERSEKRKPGPVEAGLDVRSTLSIERQDLESPPAELDDAFVAGIPESSNPERSLLSLEHPDGLYQVNHDRNWHLFWDDNRQAVLKRLDQGEVIAQCNLSVGPKVGRGRHQDIEQFRKDIRTALGKRFDQFLEAGEVSGAEPGGYRYRVAVAGHEGETPLFWYYYLLASPEGDQLLAAFTITAARAEQFAGNDLELIGSLQWKTIKPGR